MPAYAALDAAIARLAEEAETAGQVLKLAEAYDKLQHAGEEPKESLLAGGADMLDCSTNFADPPEDRSRIGFKRQSPLAY
jgi:hypothetical protein